MNDKEQNLEIAEACGWRLIPGDPSKWKPDSFEKDDGSWNTELPDYLSDLNAMKEAEDSLTERERQLYELYLWDLCESSFDEEWMTPENGYQPRFFYTDEFRDNPSRKIQWFEREAGQIFLMLNATAAQKAEALLRTKNLWRDNPVDAS